MRPKVIAPLVRTDHTYQGFTLGSFLFTMEDLKYIVYLDRFDKVVLDLCNFLVSSTNRLF